MLETERSGSHQQGKHENVEQEMELVPRPENLLCMKWLIHSEFNLDQFRAGEEQLEHASGVKICHNIQKRQKRVPEGNHR
jgi:hypothetical protein